jgi:hypothetical protein
LPKRRHRKHKVTFFGGSRQKEFQMKFLNLIVLITSLCTLSIMAKADPAQDQVVRSLLSQIQAGVLVSKKTSLPCRQQFLKNNLETNFFKDLNGIGTVRIGGGGGSPEGAGTWTEKYLGTVLVQPENQIPLMSLGFYVQIARERCTDRQEVAKATISIFSGPDANVIGSSSFEIQTK